MPKRRMVTRSAARKRVPNDHKNDEQIEVNSGSDNELPSAFLKLTDECAILLFDYLPLKDLDAMGQTCKRMNQIAGQVFQQNYPGAVVRVNFGKTNLTAFNRFITSVSMMYAKLQDFRFIASSNFDSLKHIHFFKTKLTTAQVGSIRQILTKIEIIEFTHCDFYGDIYGELLKHCVNLKSLTIQASEYDETITGIGNDWLLHKYPTIEHFKLHLAESQHSIDELKTFFKQNPQIRNLSLDSDALWENQATVLAAQLKLEHFETEYDDFQYELSVEPIPFLDLLNELHGNGMYQRLHMKFTSGYGNRDNEIMNAVVSVHVLEKLTINVNSMDAIDYEVFKKFINLKELELCGDDHIQLSYMNVIAKCLPNIERIAFDGATIDEVFTFVCHSAKLNTIKVSKFINYRGTNVVNGLFKLPAWSKEREKLTEATKITIYVGEKNYLNTKYALKKTNFEFIELKRIELEKPTH